MRLGKFSGSDVSGTVLAKGHFTLLIQGFLYNGSDSMASFKVGKAGEFFLSGTTLEMEQPTKGISQIGDALLPMPKGIGRIIDLGWISVWGSKSQKSYGHLFFERDLKTLDCFNVSARKNTSESFIGTLTAVHHGVSGELHTVDDFTLRLKNFTYDGKVPGAEIVVGLSGASLGSGYGLRLTKAPLPAYQGEDLTLSLPNGVFVGDLEWLSVWSQRDGLDLGHVYFDKNNTGTIGQNTPTPSTKAAEVSITPTSISTTVNTTKATTTDVLKTMAAPSTEPYKPGNTPSTTKTGTDHLATENTDQIIVATDKYITEKTSQRPSNTEMQTTTARQSVIITAVAPTYYPSTLWEERPSMSGTSVPDEQTVTLRLETVSPDSTQPNDKTQIDKTVNFGALDDVTEEKLPHGQKAPGDLGNADYEKKSPGEGLKQEEVTYFPTQSHDEETGMFSRNSVTASNHAMKTSTKSTTRPSQIFMNYPSKRGPTKNPTYAPGRKRNDHSTEERKDSFESRDKQQTSKGEDAIEKYLHEKEIEQKNSMKTTTKKPVDKLKYGHDDPERIKAEEGKSENRMEDSTEKESTSNIKSIEMGSNGKSHGKNGSNKYPKGDYESSSGERGTGFSMENLNNSDSHDSENNSARSSTEDHAHKDKNASNKNRRGSSEGESTMDNEKSRQPDKKEKVGESRRTSGNIPRITKMQKGQELDLNGNETISEENENNEEGIKEEEENEEGSKEEEENEEGRKEEEEEKEDRLTKLEKRISYLESIILGNKK